MHEELHDALDIVTKMGSVFQHTWKSENALLEFACKQPNQILGIFRVFAKEQDLRLGFNINYVMQKN